MAPNIIQPGGSPPPGTRLTLTLERIGAEARAVGRHEGKAVLVARGLVGERVEVELAREQSRYALGVPTAVLAPSPDRVEARCAHFGCCGGCDWQHLAYPRQLDYKRQVVEDQLRRIGGTTPPADWRIEPSEQPYEYRDKLEFHLVPGAEGWAPGYHGWPEAAPVPIVRCHLAPEPYSRLAWAVAAFLNAQAKAAAAPVDKLTVQGTAGEDGRPGLALTLHPPNAAAAADLRRLAEPLSARLEADFPELLTVLLAPPRHAGRGAQAPVRVLKGPRSLVKTVAGRSYRVPPGAFFQVNPRQTAQMVAHVLELFGTPAPGRPATFDLFCGVGLFTLPLAQAGHRMVGVEGQREAMLAARRNGRATGLACRFEALDLGQPGALGRLLKRHGTPAAVLLNPPRRGLAAPLAAALREARPPKLVYVSCDGATFARDAARLAPVYTLESLRGFDQFPQTHHLELIAGFSLRPE